MPKIKLTKNRIVIHVGDLYKKYHRSKNKKSWTFRIQDVGRMKNSERIACKYRGKWRTYAWSFSRDQVKKRGRTLLVYDTKAYEILKKLKDMGEFLYNLFLKSIFSTNTPTFHVKNCILREFLFSFLLFTFFS